MSAILSIHGLSKAFGSVPALSDVSFSLARGEIRGICGENGAGKSTFVKILMGLVSPDAGTIAIDGVERVVRGARHAHELGLGLVAQELSLAPHLSIFDNIWLGSKDVPLLHRRPSLRRRAEEAMATLNVGDWDLDQRVGELTIGKRQIVEIARLLARDARILILDEPSATLSDIEIERLMEVLRTVRDQGRSVIYITHRLGEVFELCDTVSVFRNGEHIATKPVTNYDRGSLIEAMIGRSFREMYPSKPTDAGSHEGGLVVEDLWVPGAVDEISFAAPRGKIACIAGQIGSGATTVTRALAGLIEDARGNVFLDGQPLRLGSLRDAITHDVQFITEDRADEGVFLGRSALDNLVAGRLREHSFAGVLRWPALRRIASRVADAVSIPRGRLQALAGNLSGGNQQKLLFARAVDRSRPGVLLMNEPTQGVDVGARAEIYGLMRDFCEAGFALVMTSSDLEEVIGMADIVYTTFRGKIVARYEGDAINMSLILRDIAHPDQAQDAAA